MNRKIEDVKINKIKRIIKIPTENIVVRNEANHNPTYNHTQSNVEDTSKYEFLKKKNNTTLSKQRISSTPRMPGQRRPFNKTILFIFILSIIAGAVYLFSTIFLQANVTVVSKNKTFELKHQKINSNKLKSGVPFEIMIVSDKEERDIVLTDSKEVSEKAKGEITLYNEYSTKSQKINSGSFISDEKGKTYKIDNTVTIPAYKLDPSKKIIPGQVVVGITAFLPGETYNGEPSFFTINSFKGTDKFKKIYGKANTKLEGGMTGLVYLLDDNEKNNLPMKVSDFKEKLVRKLSAQVPVGYILYGDAMTFGYELGDTILSKTPDAKIEMTGTLSAVLIKEIDLSNYLINKLLPDIEKEERSEILQPNISNLIFNFTNKDQIITKDTEEFDFELTGNLELNWRPDVDSLKGLILGKNKNEISEIFKKDKAIVEASVKIIPFWSKKLPDSLKNINIILK